LQALIQPILGIGPATWAAIAEGFRNNWKDIRDTIGHVQLLVDLTKSEDSKGLVCLSGTRDETVKYALEKAGYDVTDSWSSKVDVLLIPDGNYRSSKVIKALNHHVPIFTVDDALVNIIKMGSIL
jgi:NAD-dependent DNA ligase